MSSSGSASGTGAHQRRGGDRGSSRQHAASSTGTYHDPDTATNTSINSKRETKSGAITDSKKLVSVLNQAREKALSNGLTAQQFQKCAERASKQAKLRPSPPHPAARSSRCGRLVIALKMIWLLFLMLLALAMLSAAIKPVMFYMHKVCK